MSETASEETKFPYPEFSEKGKIICQVCGKEFMILTPSHLKTHGLTYSEYHNQFPGAPISNDEFKALSTYSKPSKYSKEDMEILGEETVIEEDIPTIDDDFEIPKEQVTKEFDNPMDAKKHEIIGFLSDYMPNVKMDYQIEVYDGQGRLIFSAISDFADPIMMINVQFPDTFWHNMESQGHDPNRTRKLAEHGWKVIEIPSTGPTIKAIEKAIRTELNL